MTLSSSPQQRPPTAPPERVDKFEYSDASFAENDMDTANRKETGVINDRAGDVHYKLPTSKELRVRQHLHMHQNETTRPKVNWKKEVEISAKYQFQQKPFIRQYALRIPVLVRGPNRTHQHCKTLDWTFDSRHGTGTLRPIPRRPKISKVLESRYNEDGH